MFAAAVAASSAREMILVIVYHYTYASWVHIMGYV
jgi:hypothetical protein